MKQIFIILILLLSCSFAFGQKSTDKTAPKHPVEIFFTTGIEDFNAHDLDKFMQQFADDVEMYTPAGWLRGKAAVRERFAQTFKQFSSVKMEIEDLKVREVAPETVVVDFKWKTYPMGKGPAFYGVGSGIYVKRKTGWVEVLEHETVLKVDDELKTSGNR
jgi:uncharacterized protein (TIGR02246 family)